MREPGASAEEQGRRGHERQHDLLLFRVQPGATNNHTCEKMKGDATSSATSADSFKLNMKPPIGFVKISSPPNARNTG